jgi:hypothetical protein
MITAMPRTIKTSDSIPPSLPRNENKNSDRYKTTKNNGHFNIPNPWLRSFCLAFSGCVKKRAPVMIRNQAKIKIKTAVFPNRKLNVLKEMFLKSTKRLVIAPFKENAP